MVRLNVNVRCHWLHRLYIMVKSSFSLDFQSASLSKHYLTVSFSLSFLIFLKEAGQSTKYKIYLRLDMISKPKAIVYSKYNILTFRL